jgi:hypothetical protein
LSENDSLTHTVVLRLSRFGQAIKPRRLGEYNDASDVRSSPSLRNQLAASPRRLRGLSTFTPALRIDGQSLPQGVRYPRSLRGRGMAPLVKEAVVKGQLDQLPPPSIPVETHISEERTTHAMYSCILSTENQQTEKSLKASLRKGSEE